MSRLVYALLIGCALALAMLLLNGCATANIATKSADGRVVECQASFLSILKESDTATMSACGGKGGATGSKANTALGEQLIQTGAQLLKLQ